jgi:hypothetical protein
MCGKLTDQPSRLCKEQLHGSTCKANDEHVQTEIQDICSRRWISIVGLLVLSYINHVPLVLNVRLEEGHFAASLGDQQVM